MKIPVEFDGRTYETLPISWDEIDRIEQIQSGFLLNLAENLAEAKTKVARRSIATQLMKTKSDQRKIIEEILRKYCKLSSKELIDLGFIGATLLFGKIYKANTDLEPFLEKRSEPVSSPDSPQKTETSTLSPS